MLVKLLSFKKFAKNTDKLAVLFLGSIEQHGPFIPLGTDTLMAEALSEQLEKNMGDKLVIFPVLPFGAAKEHRGFAGTIYLNYTTYMLLLKEIIAAIFESGFKRLLLISTHGGNDLVARLVQADCNYGNSNKVEYFYVFEGDDIDRKTKQLFGGTEMHAGSSENSIIAFLHPQSVCYVGYRTNKKFAPKREGAFTLFSTREMTKLGILNFSSKLEVDPKKGEELFKFIAHKLCQKVKDLI